MDRISNIIAERVKLLNSCVFNIRRLFRNKNYRMIRKRLEYSATLFDERYPRQDFLPFDSLEPEVVLQTCLQRTINFVTFDLINAILSYFDFDAPYLSVYR